MTEARKKKILIVEDNSDIAQGLSIRLTASGYQTVTTAKAHEALQIARKDAPDLVLLDIGLTDTIGLQLIRQFQHDPELATIPFIILSGVIAEYVTEWAVEAGVKAYFQKPANNEKLLDAIHSALEENRKR